jgi:hypothetical protein
MADRGGCVNYREADGRMAQAVFLLQGVNLTSTWLFHVALFYSRIETVDIKGFEVRMALAGEIEQLAALKRSLIMQDAAVMDSISAIPGNSLEKKLFTYTWSELEKNLHDPSPDLLFLTRLEEKYRALARELDYYGELRRSGADGGQSENLSRMLKGESRLASQGGLTSGEIDAISRNYIWKEFHSPEIGDLQTKISFIQASRRKLGKYIFAREKTADEEGRAKGKPRGRDTRE